MAGIPPPPPLGFAVPVAANRPQAPTGGSLWKSDLSKKSVQKKLDLTFELSVKNFAQLNDDFRQNIDDIGNYGLKFWIELQPNAFHEGTQYLSFQFGCNRGQFSRRIKWYLKLTVAIIDKNGVKVNKICSPILCMNLSNISQSCHKFVKRDKLLSNGSGYLNEGTLHLSCHLELSDETPFSLWERHSTPKTFEKCFKSLLNDIELSDFTVVVDDHEFRVHKSVLAARSPVFRAMITSDMKEKKESKVVLHDFDKEVFEQFVHFLYTGKALKVKQMAQKLSQIADFFDVPDLKVVCAQTLFSELTEDNVIEALKFGETFGIRELVVNAIDYIGDNCEKVKSKFIQQI